MALNDDIVEGLRLQGYTGAINNLLLQWAQQSSSKVVLNEAVLEHLQTNGATANDISSAWIQALSIDYSGSLTDMYAAFWKRGGSFVLKANTGWTGGFGCG